MANARELGRYRAPTIVATLNPLIRRMLGAGLRLGPNVVFTVRGRSSGLPRSFPIAIMDVAGQQYIQSPYGEVNWVRNLRANPEAIVTRGSDREVVEATELTPEDGAAVLRAGVDRYLRSPWLRPFVRVFTGIRRDSTTEEIVAHIRRHPMFRLTPNEDRAPTQGGVPSGQASDSPRRNSAARSSASSRTGLSV